MFISRAIKENLVDDDLSSIYTSKFVKAPDVLTCKRSIIIHNDVDKVISAYGGIYNAKCTIINLSVLDGRYHYDKVFSPETILVKTVYNGYVVTPLDAIGDKEYKVTEEMLDRSTFRLTNVYTSYIGLWSAMEQNDHFSPIGVSVLDTIDLRNAMLFTRSCVNMYGGDMSIKMDISFDGDTYQTVLPIPLPQYYSKMHSEINNDDPIITRILELDISTICDEFTKINVVNFNKSTNRQISDPYQSDITSSVEYLTDTGNKLVSKDTVPMHVACSLLRSLNDELYSKIFKVMCRYQISSLNFIYDSENMRFLVPSMTFSYKEAPKYFAETVLHEILFDESILTCLNNFSIVYGNLKIFGRVTDLKYDTTVSFNRGHKDVKELKTVRYCSSVFDIWNSLIGFETSVKSPIISI